MRQHHIRRDDVVLPRLAEQQEIAAIVHAQPRVRLVQNVEVDARKPARAFDDGRREFDDVDVDAGEARDRAGRGAAAEANHQRALRRRMQRRRQPADAMVHERGAVRIVRLMMPVEIHDLLPPGLMHRDRRLHALLAPEQPLARMETREREVERIRHARRAETERGDGDDARRDGERAALRRARESASISTSPDTRLTPDSAIKLAWLPSFGISRKPAAIDPISAPHTFTA